MVDTIHEVRNPGDVVFRRYQLEAREAFQYAADNEVGKGELDFLRQQGCEMWQGYLCCPPVQKTEVLTVLGRRSGAIPQPRISAATEAPAVKH